MQYVPPAFPIANISIANTHYDLVDRVQILIDIMNSRHIFMLDDLSPLFDSVRTVFPMTSNLHPVYATTALNVEISLNGTIQEPRVAYNVYKDQITFANPPLIGTGFFGVITDVWAGAFSGNWPADTAHAATATDAHTLDGHTEAQLNVNSAQFVSGTVLNANNADHLNGHTEAELSVGTANNATFAFGKAENQLNVNSALNVNAAAFANVANTANTALSANTANTANSAAFLAGNTVTTNSSALVLGTAGLSVNGSLGSNGQILYTNATSTYWADAPASSGGNATFLVGNTVATNSTVLVVGANIIVNTSAYFVGNSSVNAYLTSTTLTVNGATVNSTFYTGKANTANVANTANAATFLAGNIITTNASALILGAGASLYANGGKGTNGQILYSNATSTYWGDAPAGLGSHNLLSATHSDTNAAAVSRGDLIAGVGASPLWTKLAIGAAGYALTSNGTDPAWSASVNSATNANNAGYLNTHTEAQLNVNNALTSNNSSYLSGHTEGQLNVNSALASNTANSASSANNSSYLNGHTEAQLNANSALGANNSAYLNGHTEAQLNANSALGANNASYLSGHTEGQLNVNAALSSNTSNSASFANNSSYLNTHTEAQLNVNNALTANQATTALTANNSGYLNTHTEAQLNVNSALGANNASYLNTHTEAQLNVNNALTSNNSNNLGGQLPAYYTNSSNANTGTLPDARLSSNVVRYATSQTANYFLGAPDGANGNITFRALTSNDVTNLDERIQDMNIYGFAAPEDAETYLTVDATNVANVYVGLVNTSAGHWTYFVGGTEYVCTGPRYVSLSGNPPASNTYFISIDGSTGANANLIVNSTPWTLSDTDGIVPVASLLWNNSNSPKYFLGDERHTATMSRAMHRYLHTTRGTQFVSGAQVTGQTYNTSVNTDLCFSVANTTINDETITHLVQGVPKGDGATNTYMVFYHASSNAYTWRPSEVPLAYINSSSYIQWDNGSGLTLGGSINYYTSYVAITTLDKSPSPAGNTGVIIIVGRGEYGSQALAEAEDPGTFNFTGIGIAEMVILWRCTWKTGAGYGTKGKVRLMSITPVRTSITSSTTTGTVVTDHNTLLGLQGGGPGEYYHITATQWANGDLTANQANNAGYLNTHTEAQLNVNSALTANSSTYPAGLVAVKGDLIVGNATPAWAKLPAGANGYVLTINGNTITWNAATAGVSTHALLQSNVHTDTSNGTVARGDVITGQGASPTWTRLAIGANTYVLTSNGTEAVWAAPSTNGTSLNANNADYLNTHTESQLNVNGALTANNATYAFGKTEGSLNVNSALAANTCNNADFLDGNHQSELNVNSALSSNNSGYLSGHTEAQLNVNSALGANNSTYAYGKTEGSLNVNSALSANNANNSTYAYGKTEITLNVNSAISANTANNATYAYGKTEGNLNVNSALTANTANSTPFASNADLLDGQHGAYYTNSSNANTGTLPDARLSSNVVLTSAVAGLNVNSALTSNNTLHLQGFDVSINTPANAQVLTWDTVANTWYPATPTGGPGTVNAENLLGTTINANVVNSSLTKVGTLLYGEWAAGNIVTAKLTTANIVSNTSLDLQPAANSNLTVTLSGGGDFIVGNTIYVDTSEGALGIGVGAPNGAFEMLAASIQIGTSIRSDVLHTNTAIATYLKGHGKGIGFQPLISDNTAVFIANTGEVSIGNAGIRFLIDRDLETSYANGNNYGTINANNYSGTANNSLFLGGIDANLYLHDVRIVGPANGQTLLYSAANGQWYNANGGTGSGDTNLIFDLLDDISASFNSSQTTFTLQAAGANVVPVSAQNLLISLNGILQQPNAAFTVSGNTVTFTTAPETSSHFFGILVRQSSGATAYGKAENQLNVNSAVFANSFGGTVWTLPTQPTTVVYKSANDAPLTLNVPTPITFDTEYEDTGNGHSIVTNTDLVMISTNGWYHVCATVNFFDTGNQTNYRRIMFQKTGGNFFGTQDTYGNISNADFFVTTSQLMYMFAGEWIRLVALIYGGNTTTCFVRGGSTSTTMFEVTLLH